ncbi:MAG TPA: rod shape-determining protein MreC [Candidatus Paceibacterota bacterium]|nr:rod shape-determining protein MreC [Candidatus Paceibacterota bacterium]
MKMPFSRTHKRRNALLGPGAGIVSLAVGVIILTLFILRAAFPGALTALAMPFWQAGNGLTRGAGSLVAVWSDKNALASERDRLMRENLSLAEETRVLAAANTDLTRLLGSREEAPEGVLAGVLARPPVAPYDTLVVDQGAGAGVTAGAQVLGPGGAPVGTVESTTAHTSRVLLYSTSGQSSEGWVGAARLPITLEGAGAGAFRALVPRDASIAVGDMVYLPGPGAIPVGIITRVDADPSSPRATVHIRPFTSPFSITWVEIGPN